jgi:hypothetical protein
MVQTDHYVKLAWGVVLAAILLLLVMSFARSVLTSRGIVYNWFGVLVSFAVVGLAIYVVFFVQP